MVESKLSSEKSVALYSLFSFIFLVSDIFLPVPSSLVMILNGKVLGIFWGTLLSFVSGVTSSVIGYYFGSKSTKLINFFYKKSDFTGSRKFYSKYGPVSIIISKIIPVLSESVSILSGILNYPFKKFFILSVIGFLLTSLLFAIIGGIH